MSQLRMEKEALPKARIAVAGAHDRQRIYELRHEVYAEEIGQHKANAERMISDPLDEFNEYITAQVGGQLVGFISITPPGNRYSVEKYIDRAILPFPCDDSLYEMRVLTIAKPFRSAGLAATLMYAAFRWVEERGGTQVVAMGRREVLPMYLKHGFRSLNHPITSGEAVYELMETPISRLRESGERHHDYYKALSEQVEWELDFPFFRVPACFHGGAFFSSIGTSFDNLERRYEVVNADVLDAWFPPSPKVLATITEHLAWLMRTSPPTNSEGLRAAIAEARGVGAEHVLPGAGSSDLIYLAFRQWLTRESRVLILDPSYGEYAHILEKVIQCKVDRLTLSRAENYEVDLEELTARVQMGYDLIVLVNPNNPTGRHIPRTELERVLARVPAGTRVWIDEAYLEYVGAGESLEGFAARSESVVVCKSMSKVYALSGLRVAYLCGPVHQLSALVPLTPPWAVGLPAQVAAVKALEDGAYYAEQYRQTRALRAELVAGLSEMGVREIVPGVANFVMFHLGPEHPTAVEVAREMQRAGIFMRDVSLMGSQMGDRALRIAVKDGETVELIVRTLQRVLCAVPVAAHS